MTEVVDIYELLRNINDELIRGMRELCSHQQHLHHPV